MRRRWFPLVGRDSAGRRRDAGFTYLGLLIMVAVIAIASTATVQVGALVHRRAAEEDLLNIGSEFRHAFISYANATPPGQPRAPQALQDLLKDPRYPNPRRHLRRLYADPMTGKEQWGIIESKEGPGIIGVYSLSDARPIKTKNFEPMFQDFEGKPSYREWQFIGIVPGPWVRPVPAAK